MQQVVVELHFARAVAHIRLVAVARVEAHVGEPQARLILQVVLVVEAEVEAVEDVQPSNRAPHVQEAPIWVEAAELQIGVLALLPLWPTHLLLLLVALAPVDELRQHRWRLRREAFVLL